MIASHPNEGVTTGGKLRPQSRAAAFVKLVKGRPVLTMADLASIDFGRIE